MVEKNRPEFDFFKNLCYNKREYKNAGRNNNKKEDLNKVLFRFLQAKSLEEVGEGVV